VFFVVVCIPSTEPQQSSSSAEIHVDNGDDARLTTNSDDNKKAKIVSVSDSFIGRM